MGFVKALNSGVIQRTMTYILAAGFFRKRDSKRERDHEEERIVYVLWDVGSSYYYRTSVQNRQKVGNILNICRLLAISTSHTTQQEMKQKMKFRYIDEDQLVISLEKQNSELKWPDVV
ncbi:hypothetical protein RND71_012587 [Anisodus tanguticus]|uniref:CS domain-containing protein n=1 Tax=Anisodus tanguticus TaxID=243964 RepID=A0AAE1SFG6_9SOLA|nr:hypothetical protein RND71_012587 [Anisodus tanguticus]